MKNKKRNKAIRQSFTYALGAMTAGLACVLNPSLPADYKVEVLRMCASLVLAMPNGSGLDEMGNTILSNACEVAMDQIDGDENRRLAKELMVMAFGVEEEHEE